MLPLPSHCSSSYIYDIFLSRLWTVFQTLIPLFLYYFKPLHFTFAYGNVAVGGVKTQTGTQHIHSHSGMQPEAREHMHALTHCVCLSAGTRALTLTHRDTTRS